MSWVEFPASADTPSCSEAKQSCCFRVECFFVNIDLTAYKNTKAAFEIKSESCSWHSCQYERACWKLETRRSCTKCTRKHFRISIFRVIFWISQRNIRPQPMTNLKVVFFSKLLSTRSLRYLGNPRGVWWRALIIFSPCTERTGGTFQHVQAPAAICTLWVQK